MLASLLAKANRVESVDTFVSPVKSVRLRGESTYLPPEEKQKGIERHVLLNLRGVERIFRYHSHTSTHPYSFTCIPYHREKHHIVTIVYLDELNLIDVERSTGSCIRDSVADHKDKRTYRLCNLLAKNKVKLIQVLLELQSSLQSTVS